MFQWLFVKNPQFLRTNNKKIKLPSLGKSKSLVGRHGSRIAFLYTRKSRLEKACFVPFPEKTAVQAVFYLRTNKLSLAPSWKAADC